jgi:hypothetical protein
MSTLEKFGVPSSENRGKGGILKSKQQCKFRVLFGEDCLENDFIVLTQQVESVTRPIFTKVPRMDLTGCGVLSQDPETIKIVFRDDVVHKVSLAIKELCSADPFSMYIDTLDDGYDGYAERFALGVCEIVDIAYSDFDYQSSDPATITVNVSFKECSHEFKFPEEKLVD